MLNSRSVNALAFIAFFNDRGLEHFLLNYFFEEEEKKEKKIYGEKLILKALKHFSTIFRLRRGGGECFDSYEALSSLQIQLFTKGCINGK